MMFNNSNLYSNEWLNVVFSNRNKNYGAYALRLQSAGTELKALAIAAPIFVLSFVSPWIYKFFVGSKQVAVQRVVEIKINDVIHEMKKEEPKKEEAKKEEAKKAPEPAKALKSVNFSSNIELVKHDVVDPPTTAELANTIIASKDNEGAESAGNAVPVGVGITGGTGEGSENGNGNEIYNSAGVEVYPEFPGGMNAWSKFIQKHLRYPSMAEQNEIQGKVYINFVIEKDGSISDVTVVKGIGYGCDEEAVRVLKKSPKWKPGMQNNRPVRVRYSMPIGYVLGS